MGTQPAQAFKVLLSDFRQVLELRWIHLAGEVPPVAGSNRQFTVVFHVVYYPVRNVVERWIFHIGLSGVGRETTKFHSISLEYRRASAAQRGEAT